MNVMGLSSKAKVWRVVALYEEISGNQVDLVDAGSHSDVQRWCVYDVCVRFDYGVAAPRLRKSRWGSNLQALDLEQKRAARCQLIRNSL